MAEQIFDWLIFIMQGLLVIGFAVLAVFLFWHIKRINKPVIAFIFWCVLFLTSLTPAFEFLQSGVSIHRIAVWHIVIIGILPVAAICAYFVNPLADKHYNYENEDL